MTSVNTSTIAVARRVGKAPVARAGGCFLCRASWPTLSAGMCRGLVSSPGEKTRPSTQLTLMNIHYGSAWYPEHWPAERWPEDLRRMRAAGMTVVRVAEFAWSSLEPTEGQYHLDWLEHAIELAGSAGLKTVIGTPTAAPPAWLTQKYPEVLAIRENGLPETRHGARCHYSPTSPRYQEFCRQIAQTLAQRFGHNPHVLGWQIDNEYWSYSYDAHSLRRFQNWLRERYGTLDKLNQAWTNAYWSEDYSDWSQIPGGSAGKNPCLLHAGKQFMSDIYREFQRLQVDAIRAHSTPAQWITHNFHAHQNLDFGSIGRELDHVSWDPYLAGNHLDPVGVGPVLDFARGIQRKNIWVMETHPGSVNWARVNSALDKGEVRRLVWHCLGHGADAVLFWQWRNAPGGQGQYHGRGVPSAAMRQPWYCSWPPGALRHCQNNTASAPWPRQCQTRRRTSPLSSALLTRAQFTEPGWVSMTQIFLRWMPRAKSRTGPTPTGSRWFRAR
jgi:beta-galactosidase